MKRITQNGAQKEAKTEVERPYRPKEITKRRVGTEHRMTKPDDYLKRYAKQFKVSRAEDRDWQIGTNHRARDGMTYDVYPFTDTHLEAMSPPLAAKHLLKVRPGVFTIHQDAADDKVLLFEEDMLEELADDLKLKKRRKLPEAERERLAEMSRKYSPYRKVREPEKHFSESEKAA